jgi:hypothetical protein
MMGRFHAGLHIALARLRTLLMHDCHMSDQGCQALAAVATNFTHLDIGWQSQRMEVCWRPAGAVYPGNSPWGIMWMLLALLICRLAVIPRLRHASGILRQGICPHWKII